MEGVIDKGFSYKIQRNIIIALCLFILFFYYFFKNSNIPLRAITTVGFLTLFYVIDHFFDIRFRHFHYILAIIISFFGILFSNFYFIYPNYDKILHFILPFITGFLMYYMVDKLDLGFKWKWCFTFTIIVSLLGLHEILEYWLDVFFDLKLQGVYLRDVTGLNKVDVLQNRIDDTMFDMVFGTLGALFFVAYLWVRKKLF